MNVLLISVQNDLDVLGIKLLHYYLLKNMTNSFLLHLPNIKMIDNNSFNIIKQFTSKLNPILIGITLMSHNYHDASIVTKYLKKTFESIPIIWGGIHPTIAPESCLDYADYVCIGEGERTILDLANAIKNNGDINGINNLCYIDDGEVKRNQLYPLLENLDEVPSYDLIPLNGFIQELTGEIVPLDKKNFKKYARYRGTVYSVMSSRGCPFSCTYCCNNFLSNLYKSKKIRRRSIANIISELERAIHDNPELDYITFQDDCFLAAGDQYLRKFCEEYKNKIKIPFTVLSIPIYINAEKIKILRDAGLSWIGIGMQSGSDRVCKEVYGRKSFKADFLKAAKIINHYNIGAKYDIILDNPFETTEDKIETIKTLMETPKPFRPDFFSLTFYLGTELYDRVRKEGLENIEDYRGKDFKIYRKDILNFTAVR